MMRRLLILALAAALPACKSPTGLLSKSEMQQLGVAEAKWKARTFADYSYETRTFCFCPPDIVAWNRVTVRGGVVTQVERIDGPTPVPASNLTYWQPIDSAFTRLRDAVRAGYNEAFSDIKVEFDAALGFPSRVEFVEKPTVADAASITERRNVRPLP
jgi:hypothetical protein